MRLRAIWLIVIVAFSILTTPLIADAQPQAKVWRIGLFHVCLDHVPASLDGVREHLKELGYEEGKNLHLDWRNLPDEAAAHATAHAFVRDRVDLIGAFENQTIQAAKAATAEIPIVMIHAFDPLGNGFIHSLAHPGGNLTGQAAFAWEGWYAKKLELFKELVPHLSRVLVLVDPHDPLTPRLLPEIQRAAASLQLQAKVREATTQAEIAQLFGALTPGEVEGVFVASNNLETNFPSLTMHLALAHSLPMPVPLKQWVIEGGLFYYELVASFANWPHLLKCLMQTDAGAGIHKLQARPLNHERAGKTRYNNADSRPTLRHGGPRISLPVPHDAHAWCAVQTRLASCLSPHF